MQKHIIITGRLQTGTSFGVTLDTGESVFIPASLARKFDLSLSEEYEAVLAPNAAERREVTPWRAIKLAGAPVEFEEDIGEEWGDEAVLDILADHDGGMLASAVAHELFGSAKNQEVRDAKSVLEDLVKRSQAVKAIISYGPLKEVRYAAEPEDFR